MRSLPLCRDGASTLTLLAVILIVFGALWLGSRKRGIAPRAEASIAPIVSVSIAPLTTRSAAPEQVPSRAAVPVTRAAPTVPFTRAPRSAAARDPAIAYMLRRRGLCSPDPHP